MNFSILQSLMVIISTLTVSSLAMAAGAEGGHHGHISDLIPPTVNFVILMSFLIYKVKRPMSDYFANNAKEVQQIFESAETKSKEAQLRYEMFEKKIKDAKGETEQIMKNAEQEIASFSQQHKVEIQEKIEKMKADAFQRLEKEKADELRQINKELLDKIFAKASGEIENQPGLKEKVRKNILKDIRV